jgi:hypothetical protein
VPFWRKKLISNSDGSAVDVVDLDAARLWYAEKLGFSYSSTENENADVVLGYSDQEVLVYLCRVVDAKRPNLRAGHPPMLFAKKVDSAREVLITRGVDVDAMQRDSGGNQFFRFRDLEGNEIEVSQDT